MSHPNSARHITRIPGRMCINPTDIQGTDFPHGGTALGLLRSKAVRRTTEQYTITAEELGGAPYQVVMDRETPIFVAIMATWDEAIVSQLFGGSVGAATKRGVITRTLNVQRAGTRLEGHVLYLSPDDPDDPGLIYYNAVPLERMESEAMFAASEEHGIALSWHGLPDGQYRVSQEALRADIVL